MSAQGVAHSVYTAQVFERKGYPEPIPPLVERRVGVVDDAVEMLLTKEVPVVVTETAKAEALIDRYKTPEALDTEKGVRQAKEYANEAMTNTARQLVDEALGA